MQAICFDESGLHFDPNHAAVTPVDDEVVIDVIAAGICETDLQLAKGYMGFSGILGHEFVGVATSGPFQSRRVVGEINCNCHACPRCSAGNGNHCAHRTVLGIDRHDGAFAQQIAVPQASLHPIPDSVTDDQAVFIEPLAAAMRIAEQVDLPSLSRVVILGDGRLAYLCSQAISLSVRDITVVGKHDQKLARFRKLGMTTIGLDQLEPEKSFDLVVDCTGSATGMPLALQLVQPRGTVVMKTTVASQHEMSLAPIVIDEIKIVGSRCGPFDVAIQALREDKIDLSGLITHRYPLAAVSQAFEVAVNPQAFKVVFDIAPSAGS
ncbi:MAG: alcohol dehydrogenase catalytic domain-containing protein [Rubripirellula sp.]